MSLSSQQRAHFHDRGFLPLPGLLDSDELEPLRREIAAVIDSEAARCHAEGSLSDPFAELDFERRLTPITTETPAVFRALFSGVHRGPALFELLRHPKILAVMRSLLGPELACHPAYRLRPKMPDIEATRRLMVVPWHQDVAYLDPGYEHNLTVTIWLAISESTVERGCLELYPDAHHELLPHRNVRNRTYLDILPEALPASEPQCFIARPGDAILMTQLTPHRSLPNVSDRIRWSIDMRYHAAAMPTGYAREAGFVVASEADPGAVCGSFEEFDRLRREHVPGEAARWSRWPTWERE